tara:strand:- start:2574 stop:2999 length:426 start_codon:yes stop_codon:yes gene_type:complete
MTKEGQETDRRMLLIAGISVIILALSFRVLMMMEDSLYEGSGPDDGVQTATLPLMALIALLIILMAVQIRHGPIRLTPDNLRIASLMTAMFIIGMIIEPAIPRPSWPPRGDALGIFLLAIPVGLIAAMLLPTQSGPVEEEE